MAWRAPLAAGVFSFGLSLSTLGSTVYWQDSGFFLVAIHELAPLYPPGFVLYQLACKAWTLLVFFIDFTLAVHLFSALCAAGAAALMAATGSDLLRSRSAVLRTGEPLDGPLAEILAAGIAALMSCGFTFWSSGIYAKGYSFLYLVLAALLWRMVKAVERGRPSDFTWAAVLIGLAWQAHPSATCAAAALLLFVAVGRGLLGWKGILDRGLLAAGCAAGPVLILPLLARNGSLISFGEPNNLSELLNYVTGRRFVGKEGAFNVEAYRWNVAAQFFWEEWLILPTIFLAVGLVVLARRNRTLLAWAAAWSVPYTALPTFFALEGQQDHWYVAAWLPLWVVAMLGVREMVRPLGARGAVPGAIALVSAAAVFAAVSNYRWVNQRGYDLAELQGRMSLEILDRNAILLTNSDDTTGSTYYLQNLRGLRRDVLVVRPGYLGFRAEEPDGWYERLIRRHRPSLVAPAYETTRARFPGVPWREAAIAAFANANVSPESPIYFERPPRPELLRRDHVLVPAGPFMKLSPRASAAIDPTDWDLPIRPEEVRPRIRRKRGTRVEEEDGRTVYRQEAYEERLFISLLRARLLLAEWHFERGEMGPAAKLYASILAADPQTASFPEVVHPLAISRLRLGDDARARGEEEAARAWYRAALDVPNLDARLRADVRSRLEVK